MSKPDPLSFALGMKALALQLIISDDTYSISRGRYVTGDRAMAAKAELEKMKGMIGG